MKIRRRRVGLAVMRTSPLHRGHTAMLSEMAALCEECVILSGTPYDDPLKRTLSNPWTSEERTQMFRNVFGERFRLGVIEDIGGEDAFEWGQHVLKRACDQFPDLAPTDYFSGAYDDALWLSAHFALPAELDPNKAFVNNMRGMPTGDLHIVNRLKLPITGTAVRTMLLLGDPSWRELVPAVNHALVEHGFEEFRKIWKAQHAKKH